jgi:hypothetical protein
MSEIVLVLAWGAGVVLASGLGYHAGRHAAHSVYKHMIKAAPAFRRSGQAPMGREA